MPPTFVATPLAAQRLRFEYNIKIYKKQQKAPAKELFCCNSLSVSRWASPRLDNPRKNVYNENTKGAARKRLAPYRTAYQKRLTVKYLGKHSWRSVFFAFMILVVMADFPRAVEDAMRYAGKKIQQQQHFRQSHAHPSLRRSIGRIRSKKPPSRCLFTG